MYINRDALVDTIIFIYPIITFFCILLSFPYLYSFFSLFINIKRFLPKFLFKNGNKKSDEKINVIYFSYKQYYSIFEEEKKYPLSGYICLLLVILYFPTFTYLYLSIFFRLSKEIFSSPESLIFLSYLSAIIFIHYISFRKRKISLTITLYTTLFLIIWAVINRYLYIFTGLELEFDFQSFIIYLIPYTLLSFPKDFIPSLLSLIIILFISNLLGFSLTKKHWLLVLFYSLILSTFDFILFAIFSLYLLLSVNLNSLFEKTIYGFVSFYYKSKLIYSTKSFSSKTKKETIIVVGNKFYKLNCLYSLLDKEYLCKVIDKTLQKFHSKNYSVSPLAYFYSEIINTSNPIKTKEKISILELPATCSYPKFLLDSLQIKPLSDEQQIRILEDLQKHVCK